MLTRLKARQQREKEQAKANREANERPHSQKAVAEPDPFAPQKEKLPAFDKLIKQKVRFRSLPLLQAILEGKPFAAFSESERNLAIQEWIVSGKSKWTNADGSAFMDATGPPVLIPKNEKDLVEHLVGKALTWPMNSHMKPVLLMEDEMKNKVLQRTCSHDSYIRTYF